MHDTNRLIGTSSSPLIGVYRRLAQLCAAGVTTVALLTLVGWATGCLSLARWHSDYFAMTPAGGLGFMLLAAGLFVYLRWPGRRGFSAMAGALVGVLAVAVLTGRGSSFIEALSRYLSAHWQQVGGIAPGLMSPLTAAVLLLTGLALLALSAPRAAGPRADVAGILAAGATAVGAVILLGYLYGMPLLYGGAILPMALPTAAASVLIGLGLLGAAGPDAWPVRLVNGPSVAARFSRALLPVTLGLIVGGNLVARTLRDSGINPLLGKMMESLVSITSLGAVMVWIARSIGGDIDRAEAAFRSSEGGFRLFYENSPVPFHALDGEGRLVEVNQAFLDTLGYTRDEVIGRWLGDFMPEDERELFREGFSKAKEYAHAEQVEGVIMRKDGVQLTVILNARLARTPEGVFLKEYCVWSDITERKRMEVAVAEARATAETASRAKDHLLSSVSHELRTPLTPVLVTLSMLEQDPQLPASLLPDITMMRGRIELEARLIDGLLDLTRMTRGKLRSKPELVDAHTVIDLALAAATQDADAARPTIQWELKATQHCVWADATRLQQVCWNVLRNALQYTPDSGTVHIRSRNTADAPAQAGALAGAIAGEVEGADTRADASAGAGGMLELEFADTGAGIDPEFLPHVFDEFERGHRASAHRSGGLGLGMCIAKSLVEHLGGSIHAASEGPGKGATFTVRLPLAERPAPAPTTESQTPVPLQQSPVPNRSLRILLVEDDVQTSTILSRILRRTGHHVTTAATVADAVAAGAGMAAGQGEGFDLLLSDIGLPDGSGTDVMRWFGQHQPIPGIALSGYTAPEDVQRSMDAGFTMHLFKPIAIGALCAAIQEVHVARGKKETGRR